MKTILHISYDVGDLRNTDKTTAILNLVRQTMTFSEAEIIDLSRVSSPSDEMTRKAAANHLQIHSFGLPYGLFLRAHLQRTTKKIRDAHSRGLIDLGRISLIHSHKLTFEGIIGYELAEELNVPLFITLRQTDFMILKYRPDMRNICRNVLIKSSKIFYLVPVMVRLLKETLGDDFFNTHIQGKLLYLPNIVSAGEKTDIPGKPAPDAPLLTILRMTKKSVRRKNLRNLLKAFSLLPDTGIKLHIIGGGDYLDTVKKWVSRYGIAARVVFTGPVANQETDRYYARARAFIMPSFSESFGLVYAESLLNGTPILYSRGVIGFDGVFDNVGCAVNPHSVESIKQGILDIIRNNEFYRRHIVKLKENSGFRIFSPAYALKTYRDAFEEISGPDGKKISASRRRKAGILRMDRSSASD